MEAVKKQGTRIGDPEGERATVEWKEIEHQGRLEGWRSLWVVMAMVSFRRSGAHSIPGTSVGVDVTKGMGWGGERSSLSSHFPLLEVYFQHVLILEPG